MNLAALTSYQKPSNIIQLVQQAGTPYIVPANVSWNQMSDRTKPAHQVTKVASGSTYHTSSTKHTITRDRPGAMSPGGVGVDIKHNSYNRYLNRLKGKSVLKRGIIPRNYGNPIPFNTAYPIYGGKIIKTGIINKCDCPEKSIGDQTIYNSPSNDIPYNILSVSYTFNVGDYVWAQKYDYNKTLYKAQIINSIIDNHSYEVQFEDNTTKFVNYCDLIIYFTCDCTNNIETDNNPLNQELTIDCNLLKTAEV